MNKPADQSQFETPKVTTGPLPASRKDGTLLKSAVNAEGSFQAVTPAAVIGDLLGVVFRIKAFFDLVGVFLLGTTALLVSLVFLLSSRLRGAEMRTLDRIGAPRRVGAGPPASGGRITVSWPSVAGIVYQLHWSIDLENWHAPGTVGGTTVTITPSVDDPVDGTTTVTATASEALGKLFLRVRVMQLP